MSKERRNIAHDLEKAKPEVRRNPVPLLSVLFLIRVR